jgi:hypothetical protein
MFAASFASMKKKAVLRKENGPRCTSSKTARYPSGLRFLLARSARIRKRLPEMERGL